MRNPSPEVLAFAKLALDCGATLHLSNSVIMARMELDAIEERRKDSLYDASGKPEFWSRYAPKTLTDARMSRSKKCCCDGCK